MSVVLQVVSGDGEVVALMKEGSLFGEVKYDAPGITFHFKITMCR